MTPSGGHFLFWVNRGTEEWNHLARIGWLEPDLKELYLADEPGTLRRSPPAGVETGLVYSGIGRLWEYLSHKAISDCGGMLQDIPFTISDPYEECFNMDVTCYGYPAFLRSIRAPFSLHTKRKRVYADSQPMADAMLYSFDGKGFIGNPHPTPTGQKLLVDARWDLDKAVEHASQFSGIIPTANGNLNSLIKEYEDSELYRKYAEMDADPDLGKQEAYARAIGQNNLGPAVRDVLAIPNPRAKDPKYLMGFISELLGKGWHPRHISNLIADLYERDYSWEEDWVLNSSRMRADFWTRNYYTLLSGI
jgi:hypothetical protein